MAIAIIGAVIGVGSVIFVNITKSAHTLQDINEEGRVLTEFVNQRILLEKETWHPNDLSRTDFIHKEVEKAGTFWIKSLLFDGEERLLWQFEVPKMKSDKSEN